MALAKKVDEYDAVIRDANRDIAAKASTVKVLLPTGLTLELFLGLKPYPDIVKTIEAKQLEVTSLERAKEIKEKAVLGAVSIPQLPTNFEALLRKVLDDVSKEAENDVKRHIGKHVRPGGEEWIAQGIWFSNGRDCPFCGQPIDAIDLIGAYQKYFSQGYTAFKKELNTLREAVEKALGDASLLTLQAILTNNASLATFWGEFIALNLSDIGFADLRTAVVDLRKAASSRLKSKLASPLEPVPTDAEFERAIAAYNTIRDLVANYNKEATATNLFIENKKKQTEVGNLSDAKSELAHLQAFQKRYEPAVAEACRQYGEAVAVKAKLDEQKAAAKERLDGYSDKVFGQYQRRINQLLEIFGAGYRIGETKTSYVGGNVSSSFHIVINNVPVELGDSSTPLEQASFKNTLSAGDRSTLALGFFIAKLEGDPQLPDTVVLFDDPFTSQDKSRRMRTQQMIRKLGITARQVIVMSHDPQFLKQIKDDSANAADVKTLQFFRLGESNSKIVECDIDEVTRGDYFDNFNTLYKFLHENEGKPRLVVRAIRPLLESYLRIKQPREFAENDWLGDMIRKIREAPAGSPLFDAQVLLGELDAINDYSKRYHHDEGAEVEGDPIDDGELQAFIRHTFDLAGGF